MKISLFIPSVNHTPAQRPRACRYCAKPILHRHGTLKKPIEDHRLSEATVCRYKCTSCGRTFRHYPSGITRKDQSQRTVVLAALMYALGLSWSAASHLLGAFGAEVCKMSVWRDAQEAGRSAAREATRGKGEGAGRPMRRSSRSRARKWWSVSCSTELAARLWASRCSSRAMGGPSGSGLNPTPKRWEPKLSSPDDNGSYGVAAAELGLSHQLCIAHVRKYVTKRAELDLGAGRKRVGRTGREAKESLPRTSER